MAAYRRVYDSRHLQADQLRNPALGNRVWATFFISVLRVTATSTGGEVATLTLVIDDVAGKNTVGVSRSIPGNVDVH